MWEVETIKLIVNFVEMSEICGFAIEGTNGRSVKLEGHFITKEINFAKTVLNFEPYLVY